MITKIISLASRPEKLKNTVKELSKLGVMYYEWFQAFEGRSSGCDKSHHVCLKGECELMILEDDCVFENNAKEVFDLAYSQLPEDWDILYLGANVKIPAQRYSENLFIVTKGAHCCHAMLYSDHGRQKMYRLYNPKTNDGYKTIDHWLYMKGQSLMKCFVVSPLIAFQRSGYSDIRRQMVDYKKEMIDNAQKNMI